MRLIDADSFKQLVISVSIAEGYGTGFSTEFCKLIDSVDTAYDLDKVVKELEELRDFKANQFNVSKYGLMQTAIDFVKFGGID